MAFRRHVRPRTIVAVISLATVGALSVGPFAVAPSVAAGDQSADTPFPPARTSHPFPPSTSPAAPVHGDGSRTATATATATAGHVSPIIYDLDAASSTDAWAVGYNDGYPTGNASFTAHWDGTSWTTVPSDPGTLIDPALEGVADIAPDDVWAVGVDYRPGRNETDNLALHWDGSAWSTVAMPQPAGEYRALTGVWAVSAHQVYATGRVCESGEGPCALESFRYDGSGWSQVTRGPVAHLTSLDAGSRDEALGVGTDEFDGTKARSAHWNGSRWKSVAVPRSSDGDALYSVTDSGTDGWAGGAELSSGGFPQQALLLHWTGAAWQRASPASQNSYVGSVSADAPDDAWLAGDTGLEHWDGQQWAARDTPISGRPNAHIAEVLALAPDDVFALGSYTGAAGVVTTLMAYDGSHWAVTRSYGSSFRSQLDAVSAVATDDVWAVGSRTDELNLTTTQIEHWDGDRWRSVPHPEPGFYDYLRDVDAQSSDDVWAVGSSSVPGKPARPLIEHWTGSAWTTVSGLRPGPRTNTLSSVSADSLTDVWVTGTASAGDTSTPFVERWDGQSWQLVDLPDEITSISRLDVLSPADGWLLGDGSTADGLHTANVLHWDGTTWTIVFTAPYGDHRAAAYYPNDIVAFSSVDVWAVGTQVFPGYSPPDTPYAFHWDGSAWTGYDTPAFPPEYDRSSFTAVAGTSSADLWAVGTESDYGHASFGLAEHWDGSSWQVATLPGLGSFATLADVAVVSGNDVWAVGHSQDQNVVLHWDGSRWRRSG